MGNRRKEMVRPVGLRLRVVMTGSRVWWAPGLLLTIDCGPSLSIINERLHFLRYEQ